MQLSCGFASPRWSSALVPIVDDLHQVAALIGVSLTMAQSSRISSRVRARVFTIAPGAMQPATASSSSSRESRL